MTQFPLSPVNCHLSAPRLWRTVLHSPPQFGYEDRIKISPKTVEAAAMETNQSIWKTVEHSLTKAIVRKRTVDLLWSLLRSRRRSRSVLRAEKSNQLLNLLIGKRFAKRRHLGPAIQNLRGNLLVGPRLLLTNFRQRRSLLGSIQARTMTEPAALVAVKNSTSHFGRFRIRAVNQTSRAQQKNTNECNKNSLESHENIFAWRSHHAFNPKEDNAG